MHEHQVCSKCGQQLSIKEKLEKHKEKCQTEPVVKAKTKCERISLQLLWIDFRDKGPRTTTQISKTPSKDSHWIPGNQKQNKRKTPKEYMCKVCPQPTRFANQTSLYKHSIRIHNGRKDQIKFGESFINMTDDVIKNQSKKTANCTICEEVFKCKQDLDNHLENVPLITGVYCLICNKTFKKETLLNLHMKRNHNANMYKYIYNPCPEFVFSIHKLFFWWFWCVRLWRIFIWPTFRLHCKFLFFSLQSKNFRKVT